MCLVVLAHALHHRWPVIVAGNRDEAHARPTLYANFWPDEPVIFAGRDLRSGGTWLGLTRSGRFATVTNFRDPADAATFTTSRGELVRSFLTGAMSTSAALADLHGAASTYAGYGLLLYDGAAVGHYSNRERLPRLLPEGVFGLSNHLLDTPWPKVTRAKEGLRAALAIDDPASITARLLDMLSDHRPAIDDELPETGVGREKERMLSPIFIQNEHYGTRASTVVLIGTRGDTHFAERSYDPSGGVVSDVRMVL